MIQLLKSKDGQHYFIVKAANGREIARASEMYVDKRGAKRGIAAMLRAIGDADAELLHEINDHLQKLLYKP